VAARAAHHAVREQTPLPRVKDDLPARNSGEAGALDGNQITWKDGGYHAGAEDAEANFPERADNFTCQATRERCRYFLRSVHKPTTYDAFLLKRQPCWVLKTLPHASAATSKIGSNRKEGALYGFFVEAAASRALSLVDLSMFKSHVPRFCHITLDSIEMPESRSRHCRPRSCKPGSPME
jgi:hypothetical protein